MEAKTYTAEEVAEVLRERGDSSVSKRTVNYYTFEKNMFVTEKVGKSCFTELEIDKINAIRFLQTYTKLKLDDIKQIINTKTLDEILSIYEPKGVSTDKEFIKVTDDVTLLVNPDINKDKLRKIISQIKHVF